MTKPETPDADGPSAAEIDAAPEDHATEPVTAAAEAPPRARGAYFLSAVALLGALLAIGAAGYLWWQYRAFGTSVDQADAAALVTLEGLGTELRGLEAQIRQLENAVTETRGAIVAVTDRVDAIPGRLLDIEERIDASLGISEDVQRRWIRAEAEYFLTVANTELTLAGRWDSAARALELADQKLLSLADPALAGVRERVSTELASLRAVRLPDVEGHSFALSRLAEAARTLPMRAELPGAYEIDAGAPTAELTGFARLWDSLKRAVAGMVRIERRDDPVERAPSLDEQALIRQQLELELGLARLGLVTGQAGLLDQSLVAAAGILGRHFDTTEVAVESALALIAEMRELDIAPARPDISGSLAMLRSLADRED